MKTCLLLLEVCVGLCSGANILGVFPMPFYSHTKGYLPIMEELARRGHNVTVVSPFPRKEPLANYTDVFVPNTIEQFKERAEKNGRGISNPYDTSLVNNMLGVGQHCRMLQEVGLTVPELKNFINEDRSHFDAVITESFICQESLTALSHKYSAHLIGISSMELGSLEAYYTGNSIPYSYVPHSKTIYTDHMYIHERFINTMVYVAEVLLGLYFYEPIKERFMREHFQFPGSEDLPPLHDILKNHSLVLVDWHFSLSYPRPYLPNVIEFGGISVIYSKPLPTDLEEYMSEAKHGVIYLSFGSQIKTTDIDPKIIAKFLKVLSRMKQRVLMKWEKPELPGKPDNVRIAPWFPQASILAHKNMVTFITHCGIHGVSEATYYGVPMLLMPIYADQHRNMKLVSDSGYGIFLDHRSFTEKFLKDSLINLVYVPAYKEAALNRSAIMKDRPLEPLDTAVYWVEYVLRHNGARHLRPASMDLMAHEYFLLDVIVFVLFIAGMPLFAFMHCDSLYRFFTGLRSRGGGRRRKYE